MDVVDRLGRDPTADRLPARRHRALRLAERAACARLLADLQQRGPAAARRAVRAAPAVRSRTCGGGCATTRAACARRSASSRRSSTIRSWPSSTSRPRAWTRSCSRPSTSCWTTCATTGRTIFFSSSHFLSEVERVCDRVAIIRSGHLMALQHVDDLLARRKRKVQLRWRGVAPDLSEVPGLADVQVDARPDDRHAARRRVGLRAGRRLAVARGPPIEPARLEEVFLEYYAGEDVRARGCANEPAGPAPDAVLAARTAACGGPGGHRAGASSSRSSTRPSRTRSKQPDRLRRDSQRTCSTSARAASSRWAAT